MSRAPDFSDGPTAPQRPLVPTGDRAWLDRVIAGKYAVEGILGRGAMGLVLKARHLKLEEHVAIKVLHRSLANDSEMAQRMLREARAAVRLSSEHIVRVMDVDTLEDGVPYMVLEYLEGTDVASVQKSRKGAPMSADLAVAIGEQACRALAEAHALGIIHRDLKPANLFIAERPDGRRVVKLLDFGISKLNTPRDAPITKAGDILGSPRYMSPEQVRGDTLDGRSDIWALGVVLYELLTATAPFSGANFAQACRRVIQEAHVPLLELRPDLPPGLAKAVERCLEKDRDKRFSDAHALRDALAPFGVGSQRGASTLTLTDISALLDGGPRSTATSTSTSTASERAPAPSASSGSISVVIDDQPSSISASSTSTTSGESSASMSAEITLPRSIAAPALKRSSRTFFWLALGALAVGLVIGLVMLVRSGDSASPADGPSHAQASSGADTPALQSALPAAPNTSSFQKPNAPSTALAANSNTAVAAPDDSRPASSASADSSADSAPKPWRPRSTPTASAAKSAGPSADPFGERRQ